MHKVIFFCYAAGQESKAICNNISGEISSVDWRLGDFSNQAFTQELSHVDLVIIVANLNNCLEASNLALMLSVTENLNIPTWVYAIYPSKFTSQFPFQPTVQPNEKEACSALLKQINNATVIVLLDNSLLNNSRIKEIPFIEQYAANKYCLSSIELIVAIRSLVEPITKQELIGVDFADYCLAFANKGLYQTKYYTEEALAAEAVTSDSWLTAKVIIVTVFLNREHALDVFSGISSFIINLLEQSDALLLIVPVIEEQVQGESVISVIYKT